MFNCNKTFLKQRRVKSHKSAFQVFTAVKNLHGTIRLEEVEGPVYLLFTFFLKIFIFKYINFKSSVLNISHLCRFLRTTENMKLSYVHLRVCI